MGSFRSKGKTQDNEKITLWYLNTNKAYFFTYTTTLSQVKT